MNKTEIKKGPNGGQSAGLVNYFSKVRKETKDLTDAVVDAGTFKSQRELLEALLVAYEQQNPGAFDNARALMAMKAGV